MAVFDPSIEPLLRENPNRFVIFPIQYPQIWKMYKQVKNVQNAKKKSQFLVIVIVCLFLGGSIILDCCRGRSFQRSQ